ncbi:MAG: C25 family cysteine peptidase [Planctomycetota bacterium]
MDWKLVGKYAEIMRIDQLKAYPVTSHFSMQHRKTRAGHRSGKLIATWLIPWLITHGSLTTPMRGNAAETEPPKTAIVVCASDFRQSLEPWVAYRQEQGIDLRVIESMDSAIALTERIRGVHRPSDLALILVGDAPVMGASVDAAKTVPLHYQATTVSKRFGSTPTLPTDAPYGDTDGDGKMDLAVGRLPVQTPEQLTSMIERIIAYETSQDFTQWRSRLQLVGGVGGFGILADSTIESTTRLVLTTSLPTFVRPSILYGSPGHAFYPRKRFTQAVLDRYRDGCRVWVYAGHGWIDRLDSVPSGPTGSPVLDAESIQKLEVSPAVSPIAVLLCCYTGAIDAAVDSFAERLVRQPFGPIAVISGSRVTMPYGNASFTLGLVDALHGRASDDGDGKPAERLGETYLRAIERLQQEESSEKSQIQTLVDTLSALISPAGSSLKAERMEHASLYGLLGDPLLLVQPPLPVDVETNPGFDAGAKVEVRVTSPINGRCSVTLDRPLGQTKRSIPGEPVVDPNQLTLVKEDAPVKAGEQRSFLLDPPEEHEGLVRIRIHIAGDGEWAAGGAQTNIRPRRSEDN